VDEGSTLYIGKAAHITAASENGPRYDSSLSPEQRKSINNGIFLCSNCADMIDKNNGLDFSTDLLKTWKVDHENWVSLNLNKKVCREAEPTQIFNVTSHKQQGGITAGIVKVGTPPRTISSVIKEQFAQHFKDKNKTVTIKCVLGDDEAFNFATQIREYLINEGYSVGGLLQVVFGKPVLGQEIDPDTWIIKIGSRK